MSTRRIAIYFSLAFLLLVLVGIPMKSQFFTQTGNQVLLAGRNVNMVSGTRLPLGDPWLQRQNEPSIAVSSRNPMHLFAAANDYRTIDMPDAYEVRGIPGVAAIRDAWIGVFEFFDGGESPVTMLLPGFPQDASNEGLASPIHGFDTACDPIVRAGARGLFYLSGIAFNRSQRAGVVFVARYIDRNNREKVEEIIDPISGQRKYVGPIEYVDTRLVDAGNPGQFIDMPNMAVDVPRSSAPYGNVYLAYTVFLGNTDINVRGKIVFVRSTDGGITWSKQIKLTEYQHIIQRPVIAIDPSDATGRTIYVTFRRFAFGNTLGGIVFVKSIDGGLSFSKPADVATLLYPFDQWTKGTPTTSIRTNSYPTMAVDGNGVPWVAWAERYDQSGLPYPDGQARIVFSYSLNGGLIWTSPQFVDPYYVGDGHQFMPSITCAGGKKTVIWNDQRDDIFLHKPTNTKFIEDGGDHRHTIDVRAAEAPASSPVFEPSILVSRYLYYMQLDASGEPMPFDDGSLVMQGQYNFLGLPLFWLGTKPFHGDYMEVVSSPQILPPPATGNSWAFNTNPAEPTSSHGVWTDTRDVWPPGGDLWGTWTNYNPPTSIQDTDFKQENPCINEDTTGMRNQNVYTANLNHGVIVGSPGNTKQLDIQRSFVVFVKNTTDIENRSFHLSLDEIGGANASFDQSVNVDDLDITVPPYSSVSCTVYVDENFGNPFAPVIVDVTEGGIVVGRVFLNPDSTNNSILDSAGNPLGDEYHNPKISNPKVWKYDVGNQNEPNPTFLSPRAQNPRAQNSGYVNPRAQNQGIINPRAQNPRAQNPRAQNENIVNNEMENPRAQNASVVNTALTDMTWNVTNDGNTTSAYTFNIRSTVADYFNADPPPLIAQVLVYKVHTTPIDYECGLFETHADELVVNVSNPRAQNPRAQNITPTSGHFTVLGMSAAGQDFDAQDITFNLAPGEEAEVTFRVYDPDINDSIAFETTAVAGETIAEAPNTGDTEPVWEEQPSVPWENPLAAIVASPISLSFSASGSQDLYLSLSGLAVGESLDYSLSDDADWLTVTLMGGSGRLDGNPLGHNVAVNVSGLDPGSYIGTITVTVPVASNNPLRIPVYLTVGTTAGPEIRISYAYADHVDYIEDGEAFNFGSEYPGASSEEATFEIENIGEVNLTLGGKPIITIYGPDAHQFRVVQQPASPVAPDYSTTFALQFTPTSAGQKTAMISIMNNDFDENPFDIALQGTCEIMTHLVAYYPFNGNANDESGNGNHGTVSGATLTEDRLGNPNRAYLFDGVNDGIVVSDSDTLDITDSITITAWIKPNQGSAAGEYAVQKRELTHGGFVYSLDIWPGTVRSMYRYQEGGTATREAEGSTNIAADQWQQIAATWDGSTITVYYNGQPDGTAPFTDGPIMTSTGNLEIGHYTGGGTYFSGSIDDIRIYSRALSATEIQQLYAQEAPLNWHTYAGSSIDDRNGGIAVDASGNIYLTGSSEATWGSPINPHSGGRDAFVAKLNSTGELEWNTFLGSSDTDEANDIAVDGSGNVYVGGWSKATWGSPLNSHTGQEDAFVAKLNSSGDLLWNLFIGGEWTECGGDIAVDSSGNVYMTGWTVNGWSGGFWGTPVNPPVRAQDAFAVKLNSSGNPQWYTFIAGMGAELGNGIAVDAAGQVYVCGWSDGTWGTPVNPRTGEGNFEGYAVKLNSSGEQEWHTFFGGADQDEAWAIAVDTSGNIYVTGHSKANWGTPINPHSGGVWDAFVVKLDSSGVRQWHTFMGESMGWDIAVDGGQNLYVTGVGAAHPGYVAALNRDGVLQWNTFLEACLENIALDRSRNVYVAGEIDYSWGTPVNPWAGGWDAFVAKIGPTIEIEGIRVSFSAALSK